MQGKEFPSSKIVCSMLRFLYIPAIFRSNFSMKMGVDSRFHRKYTANPAVRQGRPSALDGRVPGLPRQGNATQDGYHISKVHFEKFTHGDTYRASRKAGLMLLVSSDCVNQGLDGLGDIRRKGGKILLQPAERTNLSLLILDFPCYKIFYRNI